MAQVETRLRYSPSRRKALAQFAAFVAGSPLLGAQQDPHGDLRLHRRVPGLDELDTVFDFEPLFHANVPLQTTEYTYHGDGSEFTLRRNRQAFDWVSIEPGVPVDPASVDLSATLLGQRMKFPIFISPNSFQVALHPDGEIGTHVGATAASNTLMMISNVATQPVEKIVPAATGPCWFQFYPREDLDDSRAVIENAQAAGCPAVIVTVDQQASIYERDLHVRNLGGAPRVSGRGIVANAGIPDPVLSSGRVGRTGRLSGGGTPGSALARYHLGIQRLWYTWDYLDAIHKFIKGPMIVKGILTAEDAELCVQHGVDAILVSNHGGRSMDYGPSPLEVLPDIVAQVRGRIPVLVDSGFRRGSDVFKALALGADGVGIGRANRFGLGAFGAPGVQRVLEIMQRELVQAAAAAGRRTLASIDHTAVKVNFV
jgi:isopentenyl diphosphate isomerase/L-lactate dehydrogenase-like FMN-dependent dehydrogenase